MKKLNFIILLFITNVAVFAQTLNTIKKTTNQTIQHADIETSKTIQADVVFYNLLGLHTDNKFVLQHTNIDKSGIKHDRYQQYYRGIRVEGGTYTLHGQNGKYKHISGNLELITNIATQATFTEDIALQKVMSAVGATEYAWQNITKIIKLI
jgi:Zn-dependent metalloprotease